MQSLELLLDIIAVLFIFVLTYEQNQGRVALATEPALDLSPIEITTPHFSDFNSTDPSIQGAKEVEDDNTPPWDVDEPNNVNETFVKEDNFLPFDVDEVPEVPNRAEVLGEEGNSRIDVTKIPASQAWKAAKVLGLPYKNKDRSRIKVDVLRENIAQFLANNPNKIVDVQPYTI